MNLRINSLLNEIKLIKQEKTSLEENLASVGIQKKINDFQEI